ncbi:hypothetical protein GCM10009120_13320 [Sphingobacterium siyangense subsp. cladoniae]
MLNTNVKNKCPINGSTDLFIQNKEHCDGDSKMVFILLYWPNTKRYYDPQAFIPKVFTELDEKLMRSIGLQQ